jgi:hypothetical protein
MCKRCRCIKEWPNEVKTQRSTERLKSVVKWLLGLEARIYECVRLLDMH